MAYFKSRRTRFENLEDVAQEFEHLYKQLGSFVVNDATRAPHAEDQGLLWIFRDGATQRLYIKNVKSGTWRGPINFT